MRRHLPLVVLATIFIGCGGAGVCSGAQLTGATTPSTEAAAMEEFWRDCAPLSMTAYDASGQRLSFSDTTWMDEVHSVELQGDRGRRFRHTLVDAANLGILMRE